MNDQNQDWHDRELTPAQEKNRENAELVPFGSAGISPQNFAQLFDFAKTMALAKHSIPQHFRGSPGDCLAIIEIAQKFEMSAFMLARGTYFVNGNMAFEGQAIMAIIQKWCPLQGRLKYRWIGEKGPLNTSTRQIIVTGRMKGETEDLEYESPMIKDIKVKNSPLWVEDPDQQLIYFATRRWQRRWWPEGLLNIYARDEIDEIARPGDQATDVTPERPSAAILERLKGAQNGDGPKEGFTEGFAESHFDVAVAAQKTETEPAKTKRKYTRKAKPETSSSDLNPAPRSEEEPAPPQTPSPAPEAAQVTPPKNVAEWKEYCMAWLNDMDDDESATDADILVKWSAETKLRNACGVTAEDRQQAFAFMNAIVEKKREAQEPAT